MEKLFHFDSPQPVYQADACVVSCFDARFDQAVRKFLKRRAIAVYDNVKIPGGAKALASPDSEPDRDFVLRMIQTSLRLHNSGCLVLIGHNECGGYPGAPAEAVTADLLRAADFLRANFPDLPVRCYFADFDGVYGV